MATDAPKRKNGRPTNAERLARKGNPLRVNLAEPAANPVGVQYAQLDDGEGNRVLVPIRPQNTHLQWVETFDGQRRQVVMGRAVIHGQEYFVRMMERVAAWYICDPEGRRLNLQFPHLNGVAEKSYLHQSAMEVNSAAPYCWEEFDARLNAGEREQRRIERITRQNRRRAEKRRQQTIERRNQQAAEQEASHGA